MKINYTVKNYFLYSDLLSILEKQEIKSTFDKSSILLEKRNWRTKIRIHLQDLKVIEKIGDSSIIKGVSLNKLMSTISETIKINKLE